MSRARLDSVLVELAASRGNAAAMTGLSDMLQLRVRYSETDQMGTFYNSRALEWFECGRTELMRHRLRMSYAALEARGVFLPLVEAHLEFLGGARYDDLLEIASTVTVSGRAKLRFEVQILNAESRKPIESARASARAATRASSASTAMSAGFRRTTRTAYDVRRSVANEHRTTSSSTRGAGSLRLVAFRARICA